METKRYDPGTPGEILPLGGGCYSVQSFRNRSQRYRVNLRANTCDCPHTEKRDAADCKHRKAARFAAYLAARETAETLTTARLETEFKRNFNRPEIREAIEVELTARR